MSVPARISIVTLGVSDLGRSAAFYSALGWERCASSQERICWFRTSDSYLGLYGYEALAADAHLAAAPRSPFGGITLAINLENEAAVTAALHEAAAAGGMILKAAEKADWGGFSGYFGDPDGYVWEVAFNPFFPLREDGRIRIP